MILVTGGAGFIGSNFVQSWLARHDEPVLNLDSLAYAAHADNLQAVAANPRHHWVQGSINDDALLNQLFASYRPRAVVHFAAQTHVDRSIDDPGIFAETNVVGTQRLLEACRQYWTTLETGAQANFRYLHISTDEVYGSLRAEDPPSTPQDLLQPSSPYAASKAAADQWVQAYRHTYGLPTLIVRCGNNYGPHQHPEKLIPLTIVRHLLGLPIPLYGDGLQQRDWIHVHDTCQALQRILARGQVGAIYHIATGQAPSNRALVETLASLVAELAPEIPHLQAYPPPRAQAHIVHVRDRPGHDRRYALDTAASCAALNWQPGISLDSGLRQTVHWYLTHPERLARIRQALSDPWMQAHYEGLKTPAAPLPTDTEDWKDNAS